MNNLFYLFIGYTGLWLILFSLIFYMLHKIKEQEKNIDQIRQTINKD